MPNHKPHFTPGQIWWAQGFQSGSDSGFDPADPCDDSCLESAPNTAGFFTKTQAQACLLCGDGPLHGLVFGASAHADLVDREQARSLASNVATMRRVMGAHREYMRNGVLYRGFLWHLVVYPDHSAGDRGLCLVMVERDRFAQDPHLFWSLEHQRRPAYLERHPWLLWTCDAICKRCQRACDSDIVIAGNAFHILMNRPEQLAHAES